MSSGDESKENNPNMCVLDGSIINAGESEDGSAPEAATGATSVSTPPPVAATATTTTPTDVTMPLSVNCDSSQVVSSPSKPSNTPIPSSPLSKTNLNETMLSPSDLLTEPLDFDDIDDALKETVGTNQDENPHEPIEINKDTLEAVLQRAVSITKECTVLRLLDLYNQLGKIIRKYARTHERTKLPKDLLHELTRFSKEISESSSK